MITQLLVERIGSHQMWEASGRARGAQLSEASLDFGGAKLDSLELREAEIPASSFLGSSLRNADFKYCILASGVFDGCDMTGIALRKANLDYAKLRHTKLAGADLTRTTLCESDMTGADLRDADLGGAWLRATDLTDTNMVGCNVSRATFESTRLTGANLQGISGLDEALIISIDAGTILEGYEAREWLERAVRPSP